MNHTIKLAICAIPLVFVLGASLYALDRSCQHWRIEDWPLRMGRLLHGLHRPLKRVGVLLWVAGWMLVLGGTIQLLMLAPNLDALAHRVALVLSPGHYNDPLGWPLPWGAGLVLLAVLVFVVDSARAAVHAHRERSHRVHPSH